MNHAVNKSRTKPETWVKQPSKQYMDGPQARLTIERHLALGSAGQHASVSVISGLGILLSLSVHSSLIGWLLEYSVTLV